MPALWPARPNLYIQVNPVAARSVHRLCMRKIMHQKLSIQVAGRIGIATPCQPYRRTRVPASRGARRRVRSGAQWPASSAHAPPFTPRLSDCQLSPPPTRGTSCTRSSATTQFRGPQAAIVDHVVAGGDALVLMPTGGGKSLCYQIPAIARQRAGHGVTIVVSPLIALMHDQVGALHEAGVNAAFLNSTLDWQQTQDVERRMLRGEITLLYAAPERVTTPRFLAQLDALHAARQARAVRHRRGALREPVGPRLPARVPRADGAARALCRRAAHRAHRHGRRPDARRHRRAAAAARKRASSSAASTGPTSATPSSRRRTPPRSCCASSSASTRARPASCTASRASGWKTSPQTLQRRGHQRPALPRGPGRRRCARSTRTASCARKAS